MRRPARTASTVAALIAVLAGPACGGPRRTESTSHVPDPPKALAANPDYANACAPSGLDSSISCIEVTLQAIDNARAREHVKPMALPANFPELGVPEQLLVVLDRERVDRGLPPFTGLSSALDATAQQGADRADLPPDPGDGYANSSTEWLGAVANGLDADYAWMYDDGPGSGVPECTKKGGTGCWADRHIVLDDFGPGALVMGAAVNSTSDNSPDDPGGPSVAAVFAIAPRADERLGYTWAQALADTQAGTIRPRPAPPADASATHIADPAQNVPPDPDFVAACAADGLDSSPPCMSAALQAVNSARAREGVKPLILPSNFAQLSVPEQLFVAVNRERVDRGLPAAVGRTPALDRNAQQGADHADDPPDPGKAYDVVDAEWAGGSSNGLDAVYGFMYDDGPGSTNLDCPKNGGPGCWGHRHGILDNFGTVGTLVMGAAINPTADTVEGDKGGTSMAVTVAVTSRPTGPLVQTWAQVLAATPGGK